MFKKYKNRNKNKNIVLVIYINVISIGIENHLITFQVIDNV